MFFTGAQPLSFQAAASLLLCLCPGHWGRGSTLGSRAHTQARGKQLGLAACGRAHPPGAPLPGSKVGIAACEPGRPFAWVGHSAEASPCAQRGAFALYCGTARAAPSLLSSAVPGSSRHAIKQAVKGSSQAARRARRFIKERHERLKFWHCKSWCRAAVGLGGGNLCSSRPQSHTCKRVQVASGQLVLEIHPRHPGMVPFLQDRAVVGTWASRQPRKKMPCIFQSIQTSQSSCLTFRRAM